MAKSLRSKWRQKMRNEKRKKNYPKELDRLKRVAALELESRAQNGSSGVASTTVSTSATGSGVSDSDVTPMVVDQTSSSAKKYNKRTMLDENGQYPVWMNKRRIQKIKEKKGNKKAAKKKRL